MLSAVGDALKVTVFGMAIVFAMLIIIILAVKFIEPVRRFFAGLFKRDKKESSPAKGDSAGSNANTADPGTGAVDGQSRAAQVFEGNQASAAEGSAQNAPGAPDGAVVAAIIAAVQASSGLSSRQFVLRSIRRSSARRNNNIF